MQQARSRRHTVPPIALLLVAAALACGHSSGVPTDAAGADTEPQADATPNADGQLQLPRCLRDLFARCIPTTGQCRLSTNDVGKPVAACFSSGERVEFTESPWPTAEPACQVLFTQKVFKADETLCYSYEHYRDGGFCESHHLTWKDAAGQVIATATSGGNSTTIQCEGDGETLSCSGTSCPRLADGVACTAGACPFN